MTSIARRYYHPPILEHEKAAARLDPLLTRFVHASGEESERCLASLLGGVTDQTVRAIVARTLCGAARGRAAQGLETDDVRADVLVQLIARLRRLKESPEDPIENFSAYVASIAYRTCYTHLRRLYPQRARLKNRLRYALAYDPELTLEQDALGIWRCGLTAWTTSNGPIARDPEVCERFRRNPAAFARDTVVDPAGRGLGISETVGALLRRIGEPVEFDLIVDAIAGIVGVDERPVASDRQVDAAADIPDPHEPPIQVLVRREYLTRLWREVRELPLPQRHAVLLNLRDEQNDSALPLLPLTGIATVRQIAEVLEIPALDLATLWRDLPLDDARIATRMQMTRQQVINLRKSARQRLSRRLARISKW
jgi:DNA-directed RNA polymerase specialized sigma24 family protein